MRYIVRMGRNLGNLMVRVNEGCKLGFTPIGGVEVCFDPDERTKFFYQAMVRENNEITDMEIDRLLEELDLVNTRPTEK